MQKKQKTRLTSMVIGSAMLIVILAITATIAFAYTEPKFVSLTLEGCRNDGTIVLPIGGKYVCPDAAYTTGNLGKGWNELDLVPHRLTTQLGTQAGATTDYNVYIAGDNNAAGNIGWDVISAPTIGAGSDKSCSIDPGKQLPKGTPTNPFGGGTDIAIYRLLTIHQNPGTTCVFDYYQRLAVGAHDYPGSSLQSYLFEQDGLSGSKKTISIPVNDIKPQVLHKDMSATQGSDHIWDITKNSTPATLSFGNTCDASQPTQQALQIKIEWTKGPANPNGPITIITHIYADNPAARVVTTTVTDTIYSGTTKLDETTSLPIDVPANTANYLLLTHTIEAPSGSTNLNDIATATYTDKVTNIPVPGTNRAFASASVQFTGPEKNQSAVIKDSESINGTGLAFSADSFTPAIGSFDSPYTAGTKTTDPVGWTSTSQPGSGSVTFNKQVYIAGPSIINGTLSDTASLTGSDGFSKNASLDVGISTNARVSLTINKTIDTVQPVATAFSFQVKNGTTVVETPVVSIPAGATSGSVTVGGLTPDVTYTISEDAKTGWKPLPDQTAKISLPSCAGSLTFDNIAAQPLVVTKTTDPTYTRTFVWSIEKLVDKTKQNIADGQATFNYTVNVSHDAGTDSAWIAGGKITVKNPNIWGPAIVADVTDSLPNASCLVDGAASKQVTVAPNTSVDVPYTCTYALQPAYNIDLTNTAKVTWDKAVYGTLTGEGTGSQTLQFTTPGTIVDGSVDVTDTLGGALGSASYTDPSPKGFTYPKSFAGVSGTCTGYDNTATFTTNTTGATGSSSQKVTVCVGKPLTVSKTAAGAFNREYLWQISKAVDQTAINIAEGSTATFNYTVTVAQTGITDSAWTLGGKITISNPNDWEDITPTGLADAVDNGGACTVDPGPYVVPAGKSLEVAYTCAYSAAPSSYSGTNTAAATWDKAAAFTTTDTASGSAGFNLAQDTTKDKNKTVTVTDTLGGPLGTLTATDAAPFTSQAFKYSYGFKGVGGTCTTYDNTATITETSQTASQTVKICVGKDLTVSKSAAGAFNREYLWQISKAVDKTTINIANGGAATFNYTVTVNQTGVSDSAWTLSGAITITNPNDWEDIPLTALTDAVDNGGLCNVADPVAPDFVVPMSGSINVPYVCTYATAPSSYSGTNTATATWDKTTAFTPTGAAAGSASFSLAQATGNDIHKTVNVTDTFGGALGSVTATDATPFATKEFTYSHGFNGVGGTCTNYDNTATITETGQSASKTVTVCVGLDLTVKKTVVPAFTRTYTWGISKAVDKTTVNLEGTDPQSATFNYTVSVTHDTGTDSGWTLNGTITVANPNDWEDIIANVSDAVGAVTCTVTGGTNVTIPKGGHVDLSYSCTLPDGAAGANTATAAWDKATYYTPTGSAVGSAAYSFVTPTTVVDGSVSVNDTLGGNFGTVIAADPSPKDLKYSKTFQGVASQCKSFDNTATFTTDTTATTGTSNKVTVTVCASVLNVIKVTSGVVDPSRTWTFDLMNANGKVLASDNSFGKSNGLMTFGNYNLNPDNRYTFCETNAPAGWSSIWTFNGTAITPYNPDALNNPPQDLGARCIDFGAGTAYPIPTGGIITFQVDNRYPGGAPRTIGYWRNWSSCTGGKQFENAARNGGKDAGFWMLDDVLNDPGIMLGAYKIPAALTLDPTFNKTGCEIGVSLLRKRDAKTDANMASDAAYGMAAQLIAAKANIAAGARQCPALGSTIAAADSLLSSINFTATGPYLGSKVKGAQLTIRDTALGLASTLDQYNNGMLCP